MTLFLHQKVISSPWRSLSNKNCKNIRKISRERLIVLYDNNNSNNNKNNNNNVDSIDNNNNVDSIDNNNDNNNFPIIYLQNDQISILLLLI